MGKELFCRLEKTLFDILVVEKLCTGLWIMGTTFKRVLQIRVRVIHKSYDVYTIYCG